MKKVFSFTASAVFFALLCVSCTIRQVPEQARSVSVSGTGTVYVTPDKAVITLSVVTSNKDANAASAENAERMTKVQEAVTAAGIVKDEITTSGYNIYQEAGWNNGKRIDGDYRVSNEITFILHKISDAGIIIDSAIKAGANELSSISFDSSDTANAKKQARILAVKEAEESAKLLATSSGANLGKVLSITEEETEPEYRAVNLAAKAASDALGSSTPVSSGKAKITVSVHMAYALQ